MNRIHTQSLSFFRTSPALAPGFVDSYFAGESSKTSRYPIAR
jgi:hypothetical protein